jgi:hypothetical protein
MNAKCFLVVDFNSIDLVRAASGFCLVSLEAAVEERSKAQSLLDVVAPEVSQEKANQEELSVSIVSGLFLAVFLEVIVATEVEGEVLVEAPKAHLGAIREVNFVMQPLVEFLWTVMDVAT